MRRPTKLALGLGVATLVYLLLLLLAGAIASGLVARQVGERLAESFDAQARVGDASVGLITGAVTISDVEMTRDRIDHLGLSLRRLEVDVAPLGWVVVDRAPRSVRVRGGRMVITGAGALGLPPRPERPPLHVGELVLDDVALELMVTGYWPGLARITITIEHARCGPTTMRTALSWIFTLDEMVARVDLPAGTAVRLHYRGGQLAVSGAFFGQAPVVIPFVLPRLDGADEIAQLIALGKELGKQLAIERAKRWIEPAPP